MGGGGGRRCVPSGTHANHTPLRRGRQQISKEKERETERDGMEEEKGQPGGGKGRGRMVPRESPLVIISANLASGIR